MSGGKLKKREYASQYFALLEILLMPSTNNKKLYFLIEIYPMLYLFPVIRQVKNITRS
jgi:hypothetical protein